ncbi:MAG: R3H domain-containing nucleic acid-binding protein [Prochloraceae cyanobacterium]|nr:R3H domain-containing nucleic acid-binding protein [Prochloraceae cyanobacterium]
MRERQIQRGKEWLENLLEIMGVPASVTVEQIDSSSEQENPWLTIDRNDFNQQQIEALIGPKGEAIDSIQYLANTLLNIGADPQEQSSFTVELDGYRAKRRKELAALIEEVAARVRQTGNEVAIESLSSAERRQIHTLLKDSEDLATESRGQEPNRHLVVRLR